MEHHQESFNSKLRAQSRPKICNGIQPCHWSPCCMLWKEGNQKANERSKNCSPTPTLVGKFHLHSRPGCLWDSSDPHHLFCWSMFKDERRADHKRGTKIQQVPLHFAVNFTHDPPPPLNYLGWHGQGSLVAGMQSYRLFAQAAGGLSFVEALVHSWQWKVTSAVKMEGEDWAVLYVCCMYVCTLCMYVFNLYFKKENLSTVFIYCLECALEQTFG